MIQGARCLDCFAGSGALGLEALSRHAAITTLLEQDRRVASQLEKNLRLLSAVHGQVIHTDSLRWLANRGTPYDLVFLDPPFRQGIIEQTVLLLEEQGWLAPQAWIYIETEVEGPGVSVPAHWRLHREKVAGQVAYRLFIRQESPREHDDGN